MPTHSPSTIKRYSNAYAQMTSSLSAMPSYGSKTQFFPKESNLLITNSSNPKPMKVCIYLFSD